MKNYESDYPKEVVKKILTGIKIFQFYQSHKIGSCNFTSKEKKISKIKSFSIDMINLHHKKNLKERILIAKITQRLNEFEHFLKETDNIILGIENFFSCLNRPGGKSNAINFEYSGEIVFQENNFKKGENHIKNNLELFAYFSPKKNSKLDDTFQGCRFSFNPKGLNFVLRRNLKYLTKYENNRASLIILYFFIYIMKFIFFEVNILKILITKPGFPKTYRKRIGAALFKIFLTKNKNLLNSNSFNSILCLKKLFILSCLQYFLRKHIFKQVMDGRTLKKFTARKVEEFIIHKLESGPLYEKIPKDSAFWKYISSNKRSVILEGVLVLDLKKKQTIRPLNSKYSKLLNEKIKLKNFMSETKNNKIGSVYSIFWVISILKKNSIFKLRINQFKKKQEEFSQKLLEIKAMERDVAQFWKSNSFSG